MKTIVSTILLSLAAGVSAQELEGAGALSGGNIRASKVVTDKTKRNAATSTASATSSTPEKDSSKLMLSKDRAARGRRSRRRVQDALHKKMFNKKNDVETASEANEKEQKNARRKTLGVNAETEENKARENVETSSPGKKKTKGQELSEEERELKKTKSGKMGGWGGDSWNGGGSWGGGGGGGGRHDDDRFMGDRMDNDDRFDMGHHSGHGGNGGSWNGGWGGKSDKGGSSWGGSGGKSGKDDSGGWGSSNWGSGKSGKDGSGSWGSGKSGKDGYGSSKGGIDHNIGGRRCNEGYATVTVTNLSFQQSFSEIFVMTHLEETTRRRPMFIFGNRTTEALADLAQNAEANEMINRYTNRYGVETLKIFNSFDRGSNDEKFLQGGNRARFTVRTSGHGDHLSLAMGMPFTNDGAVVLEDAHIYHGAEYWLYAIDAGSEGNIQTCWSVAAKKDDFPPQSECAGDANNVDADMNDNTIPGEGFVTMHRGIHDFDEGKDLEDFFHAECDDLGIDENEGTKRFFDYFYAIGYDDDDLLCKSGSLDTQCDDRDDADFIANVKAYDDDDVEIFQLVANSDDFPDFCDDVKKANQDLTDALRTLEPWLFDWRNDIAKVNIRCGGLNGWGNDGHDPHKGWGNDGHKDDDMWGNDGHKDDDMWGNSGHDRFSGGMNGGM